MKRILGGALVFTMGALTWMVLRHLESTSDRAKRAEATVLSFVSGFRQGVQDAVSEPGLGE